MKLGLSLIVNKIGNQNDNQKEKTVWMLLLHKEVKSSLTVWTFYIIIVKSALFAILSPEENLSSLSPG